MLCGWEAGGPTEEQEGSAGRCRGAPGTPQHPAGPRGAGWQRSRQPLAGKLLQASTRGLCCTRKGRRRRRAAAACLQPRRLLFSHIPEEQRAAEGRRQPGLRPEALGTSAHRWWHREQPPLLFLQPPSGSSAADAGTKRSQQGAEQHPEALGSLQAHRLNEFTPIPKQQRQLPRGTAPPGLPAVPRTPRDTYIPPGANGVGTGGGQVTAAGTWSPVNPAGSPRGRAAAGLKGRAGRLTARARWLEADGDFCPLLLKEPLPPAGC